MKSVYDILSEEIKGKSVELWLEMQFKASDLALLLRQNVPRRAETDFDRIIRRGCFVRVARQYLRTGDFDRSA